MIFFFWSTKPESKNWYCIQKDQQPVSKSLIICVSDQHIFLVNQWFILTSKVCPRQFIYSDKWFQLLLKYEAATLKILNYFFDGAGAKTCLAISLTYSEYQQVQFLLSVRKRSRLKLFMQKRQINFNTHFIILLWHFYQYWHKTYDYFTLELKGSYSFNIKWYVGTNDHLFRPNKSHCSKGSRRFCQLFPTSWLFRHCLVLHGHFHPLILDRATQICFLVFKKNFWFHVW
jgi:hypothetical protein